MAGRFLPPRHRLAGGGEGKITWTRIGPVILAIGAMAAFFWWSRPQQIVEPHRTIRQFMVYLTLSRFDDPVIVLGDSNVEASTLPRSLCNHAVVNAGLNGASTASDLGTWLAEALAGRRAAMIVVALGTNDALSPCSAEQGEVRSRRTARCLPGFQP